MGAILRNLTLFFAWLFHEIFSTSFVTFWKWKTSLWLYYEIQYLPSEKFLRILWIPLNQLSYLLTTFDLIFKHFLNLHFQCSPKSCKIQTVIVTEKAKVWLYFEVLMSTTKLALTLGTQCQTWHGNLVPNRIYFGGRFCWILKLPVLPTAKATIFELFYVNSLISWCWFSNKVGNTAKFQLRSSVLKEARKCHYKSKSIPNFYFFFLPGLNSIQEIEQNCGN